MKTIYKNIITALLLFWGSQVFAQNSEIKAFQKQNKEMLKLIKKQYKTKPVVKLSDDGLFYIELIQNDYKQGSEQYFLLDETGNPLYAEWIDKYKIINQNYIFVAKDNGSSLSWGVINSKGMIILPVQFANIVFGEEKEAGMFSETSGTYWHPANQDFWLTSDEDNYHHTFFSLDGQTKLHEYNGLIKKQLSYYWTISPKGMRNNENKKGLLSFDGEVIFDQNFNSFYISSSGFIHCFKKEEDGLSLVGGKNICDSSFIVPPIFHSIVYDDQTKKLKCKMHRDDNFEEYDPEKTYEVSYKDKGERLYDMGKYQEVITFYEGEGYGALWGDYYMGLSAGKIADLEMLKMDNVISTLSSSENYYLPIKYPENYTFDAGIISNMYTSAGVYLEKYICNDKISPEDSTITKAKKLRGEIISARNNVTKKIEEYGTALQTATTKNIERERKIAEAEAQEAQRQAEAQRAIQQTSQGITNLLLKAIR